MLGFGKRDGEARAAVSRKIKRWVAEAASLPESATVIVGEIACAGTGCPPRETVIAILLTPGTLRQQKIPRAMAELTRDDIAHAFATDA